MPPALSRWLPRLLAMLSGGLLVFAYPRWSFEAVIWLWMLPLLAVLWPLPSVTPPRHPFRLGWLAGMAFFVPNLFWIRHSSRVFGGAVDNAWVGIGPELLGLGAVIGLSGCCALCFGAWASFAVRVARPDFARLASGSWQQSTWLSLRSAFLAAAAWVGLEWLRSMFLFSGFGWNGLGVGFHQNLVLIQAADLVGVLGLSFLPVFVVCCGYNTAMRLVLVYRGQGACKSRLDFTFAMVLLLAVACYGYLKIGTEEKDPIKVRTVLIQTNIPQVVRWSGETTVEIYQRLAQLTRLYAEARNGKTSVDMVIWPESALPINLFDVYNQLPPGEHVSYLNELLAAGDFSLVTGTDVLVPRDQAHTSVALLRGQVDETFSSVQFYHKVNLVAFGEYLPLRNIPPFSWLKGVLPGDFVPGTQTEPLLLAKPAGVQLIPLICFEDTVGRLARRFVRDAPQIIVNVTNDGWFLQSEEIEVHLANAKFRAIELRRPMCRATNTGVTCFIDTKGREVSRLADPETKSTFIEGCLPGEILVPSKPVMTLYARYGEWFPITLLALSGIALLLRLTHRFGT
ncbi:MAG: apolipoprotein N-acyltransferase [Prosthecobacter sp.]|nr:apolipoprotein N-acyltransferase [Prosthecobacter sp.]